MSDTKDYFDEELKQNDTVILVPDAYSRGLEYGIILYFTESNNAAIVKLSNKEKSYTIKGKIPIKYRRCRCFGKERSSRTRQSWST